MSRTSYLHRFLRQPNLHSDKYSRIGNRATPFENTLTVLKDPKTGRELYLIGTTNSSTLLANRTKKLVSEVKPDEVIVQASQQWWKVAKNINLDTQSEWNYIGGTISREAYVTENNPRGIWFRLKYFLWNMTLKNMIGFPRDFKLLTPGLEIKYALQEGQKSGAKLTFAGKQFDTDTVNGLRNSSHMFFPLMLWRARHMLFNSTLGREFTDFKMVLMARGGEAFAESFDKYRANYLIYLLNRVAPNQKQVIIDTKDELLFEKIYQSKSNKIVAVVNQWHVTGIEERWRRITNTINQDPLLSPIADMDIDALQEKYLINQFLKDRASKIGRTEPATDRQYITHYTKENMEYERTRHTHHRSHEDVPAPGEQHKHHH